MRHFFFIDPSCWVLDISAGISLGRSYGSIKYVVDLLMFTPEIATDYLRIWTPCRYICLPVITIVLYDSGYVTSFFSIESYGCWFFLDIMLHLPRSQIYFTLLLEDSYYCLYLISCLTTSIVHCDMVYQFLTTIRLDLALGAQRCYTSTTITIDITKSNLSVYMTHCTFDP